MLRTFRDKLRQLRGRGTAAAREPSASPPRAPQRLRTLGGFGRARRDRVQDNEGAGGATGAGFRLPASPMGSRPSSPMASGGGGGDTAAARARKRARRAKAAAAAIAGYGSPRADAERRPSRPPRGPVSSEREMSDGDEAVSSIPSTNISNDDFLNDAVPVEITRRPGADRLREGLRAALRNESLPAVGAAATDLRDSHRLSLEGGSAPPGAPPFPNPSPTSATSPTGAMTPAPPSFGTMSASSRRRSAIWKRSAPESEPNGIVAVAREACEGEGPAARLDAAHSLAASAQRHVKEMDNAITELKGAVENVRAMAAGLPSTRMPRFENLLFASDPHFGGAHQVPDSSVVGEQDVSFRDLNWCERIWDIEAMLAEQRLDAAVAAAEALQKDDGFASCSESTLIRLDELVALLASRLVSKSPYETFETARECAQHLARLGRPETAALVVLRTAEALLFEKLTRLQANAKLDLPRHVHLVLGMASAQLSSAHASIEDIPLSPARAAEVYLGWATSQTDEVYRVFVRPKITYARGLDGGALLRIAAAIQARSAATVRRTSSLGVAPASSSSGSTEPSQAAGSVFRARLLTNLRTHLSGIARDLRAALLRTANAARDDAAHVRARTPGPPRQAQTLTRGIEECISALSPVLREIPALDDGYVDRAVAHAVLAYTAGLSRAVGTGMKTGQQSSLKDTIGFVGKSVTDSLKRHSMNSPSALQVTVLIASGGSSDQILQEVDKARKFGSLADGRQENRMFGEGGGDSAMSEERVTGATVVVDDAEMREKARQMLGQQRRMAITPFAAA